MRQFLCMGEKTPGTSHFWGRFDYDPGTKLLECPQHDGAEKSVTTEPLHVHECYGCEGVFTHAEDGCGVPVFPGAYTRFTCEMCKREER